jgi:hypothetical protein
MKDFVSSLDFEDGDFYSDKPTFMKIYHSFNSVSFYGIAKIILVIFEGKNSGLSLGQKAVGRWNGRFWLIF